MTNRLYLIAYELVEWWKRYETPGPEGGLRRRLAEVVEEYERELKEHDVDHMSSFFRLRLSSQSLIQTLPLEVLPTPRSQLSFKSCRFRL